MRKEGIEPITERELVTTSEMLKAHTIKAYRKLSRNKCGFENPRTRLLRIAFTSASFHNATSNVCKTIPSIYTLWGIAFARVFGYSDAWD